MMVVPTRMGAAFDAGRPAALFEMKVGDLMFPFAKRYDVTADGQRFVVQELMTRSGPTPLTVLVNWPALLAKYQTRRQKLAVG